MTSDDALTTPGAQIPQAAIDILAGAEWITVFTGAGMSAESGVPTFRDAQTGLWENFDAEQLATPQAWDADPALVWGWYQWRAHLVSRAAPNAGHLALSALAERADEADDAPSVMVVTQNVDDLHERAGNTVVSHVHGSLFAPRCSRCGHPYEGRDANPATATDEHPMEPPSCPICLSLVRPGVVWFGEPIPRSPGRAPSRCSTSPTRSSWSGPAGSSTPLRRSPSAHRQGVFRSSNSTRNRRD